MNNRNKINRIRDMAELAQASYFNFMYINNNANDFKIGKDKNNTESLEYIKSLSINYKGYSIYDNSFLLYPTLNGEFGEIQAKNFAERYELLKHQENTLSGFSATLFQDKESKEYIFAIRGTEERI